MAGRTADLPLGEARHLWRKQHCKGGRRVRGAGEAIPDVKGSFYLFAFRMPDNKLRSVLVLQRILSLVRGAAKKKKFKKKKFFLPPTSPAL